MLEVCKGDAAAVLFLKQWFGYCLTGDVTEQVFLFLYGPGGNGKSVLVDTVAWVMGTYFRKPVDDLYVKKQGTRHKAEEAMLAGARMISVNEVPVGSSWDEAKLKLHTGGGDITANHMRENPFSFTPVFKITVLGNHQPSFPGGMDPAIKRRFRMMLMDFVPKVADRKLEQTLRAEGPGILRWMINGLCDPVVGWHSVGLMVPSVVTQVTDEYVAEQDILASWIGDRIEKQSGALTASSSLHKDWIEYRNAQGEQVDLYSSMHSFVRELEARGLFRSRTSAAKGFRDIILKTKQNSVFEDD
jgi:putative DNA primase/helicase